MLIIIKITDAVQNNIFRNIQSVRIIIIIMIVIRITIIILMSMTIIIVLIFSQVAYGQILNGWGQTGKKHESFVCGSLGHVKLNWDRCHSIRAL